MRKNMKALIAMSGGVDSGAAAIMMKEAGYECIGCIMRLYDKEGSADIEDARAAADKLGIPFHVFDFRGEFREQIMCRFAESYINGMTPNPCVDCNRYFKFGLLSEKAEELGCDVLVTGHYACIDKETDDKGNEYYVLRKASDPAKDQSYFLHCLTQKELSHTMFPLNTISKSEARVLAGKYGLGNASKSESQDICFVPDGDYASVVESVSGSSFPPGEFTDTEGKLIGKSRGIIHYTIGQRKGLGIASTEPYYVCGICPEENRVVLGRAGDIMSTEARVRDVNWMRGEVPEAPVACKVKIRYRHKEDDALVIPTGKDTARIEFMNPQRAITPGQSAVFYDGDKVLGGGVFIRPGRS
ncbi:MAG: tRNA 2-thiouridine(34) synthase MnmA [Parasporobacterium sp.]|nr:tRNA 2-thiouridine(34) synthase MnmA [Parasporobacterium sp.]